MAYRNVRSFFLGSSLKAAILLLASLAFCGALFAGIQGAPSVLPPKHTTEPQIPETGEGQIEPIDQYENDSSVEKLSIGAVVQAVWHEDASYINRDPSSDSPGYHQWDFDIEYGGHFTTRIYKIPRVLQPAKVVIPKTTFTLYAKKITGSAILQDKDSRLVSTNVEVVPSISIVTGQEKMSENILNNLSDSFFQIDLSLSGGVVTPTAGLARMAVLTPFMAIMRPQGALEMAGMNPAQVLLNPTALMDKMKTTYFKLPILIDGFSINQLKNGPVTQKISDRMSGPGLIGTAPYTTGQLNCAVDVSVTLYLKAVDGGGYDPNKKESGPYVPEGAGTGGPGKVGPSSTSDTGAIPSRDGKRPATLSNGSAGSQNAGTRPTVLAKAVRILNRALRDMEIQNDAGNFMGLDYKNLQVARKRGLLYYFIDEGRAEGVSIRKGAPFYFNKLNATYNAPPGLSSGRFVDTLTNLIVTENDWTEQA